MISLLSDRFPHLLIGIKVAKSGGLCIRKRENPAASGQDQKENCDAFGTSVSIRAQEVPPRPAAASSRIRCIYHIIFQPSFSIPGDRTCDEFARKRHCPFLFRIRLCYNSISTDTYYSAFERSGSYVRHQPVL